MLQLSFFFPSNSPHFGAPTSGQRLYKGLGNLDLWEGQRRKRRSQLLLPGGCASEYCVSKESPGLQRGGGMWFLHISISHKFSKCRFPWKIILSYFMFFVKLWILLCELFHAKSKNGELDPVFLIACIQQIGLKLNMTTNTVIKSVLVLQRLSLSLGGPCCHSCIPCVYVLWSLFCEHYVLVIFIHLKNLFPLKF